MRQLEQHAIGIAVHDALDRTVGVISDRVGKLPRFVIELGRVWNELTRDGIVRVVSVDQSGQ